MGQPTQFQVAGWLLPAGRIVGKQPRLQPLPRGQPARNDDRRRQHSQQPHSDGDRDLSAWVHQYLTFRRREIQTIPTPCSTIEMPTIHWPTSEARKWLI